MAGAWLPVAVAFAVVLATAVFFAVERLLFRPLQILKDLQRQGVPGYPFRFFWGQIPNIREMEQRRNKDPAFAASTWATQFFVEGSEKFGKTWSWSLAFLPRVMLLDPAMVRVVHVTKKDKFRKPAIIKAVRLLGNGLVTSEGELWAQQRRLLTPAFHMVELRRLYRTMVARVQHAVRRWHSEVTSKPGVALPMDKEFSNLTLDIVCSTAFGMHLSEGDEKEIRNGFELYMESANKGRLYLVFPLFRMLPTAGNKLMRQSEQRICRMMKQIVDDRVRELVLKQQQQQQILASGNAGVSSVESVNASTGEDSRRTVDLLQLMLESTEGIQDQTGARKEAGPRMSEQQLMDECITFMLAGHETTGVTLSFAVMLLSKHKEWQDRAREEVQKLNISLESPPGFDTLSDLKVTTWVLQETLRLYPPAGSLTRTCIEATKVSDSLTIPKGCDVVVPIEAIHLSEDMWGPDCREFNPQRFSEGTTKAAAAPGAYIPFGLGPRVCIGQNFAMMEAKLVLSLLLSTFRWSTAETYRHHPAITLTTGPKHGVPTVLVPLATDVVS